MIFSEEAVRPVDLFDAAQRITYQHTRGGRCWHCTGDTCRQLAWALDELTRHPGGQQVLDEYHHHPDHPTP
ncbi:hypothetical protein [Micromonospora sp. NPDC005652]|uniref:hypothetical protein n=1 Tax=Micromonospora sp. NPDC005652 TaxID=3157046 RepID=UPI003402574F